MIGLTYYFNGGLYFNDRNFGYVAPPPPEVNYYITRSGEQYESRTTENYIPRA